ncbi:hypothetical protein BAUCODRAFT_274249 [Baudoinia panamericana UAMH 10762]|uniref:DUF7730 domain-containing protein n=1 Tax=Baudoinia panamericana (strain UAMH 10762) TaxID=717646 RepID=M2N0C6_BAUPA|nr:uncharacterized protein BAUCODRAFT_274249 [Baudoinia panamericana UAMH 10762]EMC92025.1 hypothetical protein BAUCODRAFT_274249 [Baudoinia panamericana UAMH 10762]
MAPAPPRVGNSDASPLLDLPPELRNKIYGLVFGKRTIHVGRPSLGSKLDSHRQVGECLAEISDKDHRRSMHHRAVAADSKAAIQRQKVLKAFGVPLNKKSDDVFGYGGFESRHKYCQFGGYSHVKELNLLRTCKQIHDEAAGIPFASNEFTFQNAATFASFVASIAPHQHAAIRNVTLYALGYERERTWAGTGLTRSLTSLTGLRRVVLTVAVRRCDLMSGRNIKSRQTRQRLFAGLEMLKDVNMCEIEVLIINSEGMGRAVMSAVARDESVPSCADLVKWEEEIKATLLPSGNALEGEVLA